jgi:ArsR family transcriptional regulator
MGPKPATTDDNPSGAVTCDPDASHGPGWAQAVDEAVIEAASRFFRAAGEPARLSLLTRLREGERCVSELAEACDAELSTISQRLRLLHSEGLVRKRRDGKHVRYRLADQHVRALIDSALGHAEELSKGRT